MILKLYQFFVRLVNNSVTLQLSFKAG